MRPSRTAEYIALYRALETEERRREPLFRDPLAKAFLRWDLRTVVVLARAGALRSVIERYIDRVAPRARTSAIRRTRFIDDVVRREALAGTRQLVILGAGYDCRAHRLPELAGTTVFEVDRRETQMRKCAVLGRLRVPMHAGVAYVAVDFQRDDLAARLREAGWDSSRRATFIWEGVSNYLSAGAVEAVLAVVAKAAPGSALVFTYVHRGLLDGSMRFDGGSELLSKVRRLGEPWTFGLHPDETAVLVGRFGLGLEEDVSVDELRARYGSAGARGQAFYRIAVCRAAVRQG